MRNLLRSSEAEPRTARERGELLVKVGRVLIRHRPCHVLISHEFVTLNGAAR